MTTTSVSWCTLMLLLFAGFRSRTLAVSRFNNVAGPYRLIPDHAERCPVSEGGAGPLYKDIFWRGYHDRNNVNLWHYWINFTTLDNFDDSYDIDLNYASWSSRGGWKENAYVIRPGSYCRSIPLHDPELWRRAMIATFNDPNRKCPFPAGYYEIKNISTEFSFKNVPVFFYGTWRITVRMLKAQTARACFRFFGKTVPK
ncbi:uncharacterized protein LOC113205103 [Frankliniella occidentalis]|uniref:Uncharacterized protein LOC113205103 n=1 Tax=Frankliniella occidentalis TaxID=133901 RepID=A0A9C6XVT7_FRAOC|nr:uncharacterized protein LOC113205103 [Frankliniella occidentalis]